MPEIGAAFASTPGARVRVDDGRGGGLDASPVMVALPKRERTRSLTETVTDTMKSLRHNKQCRGKHVKTTLGSSPQLNKHIVTDDESGTKQ
jgi:hypothetical protein